MVCHPSAQEGVPTPWHPTPPCPTGETEAEGGTETAGAFIAEPVRPYTDDGLVFPFNSVGQVKSSVLNDLQLLLRSK